MKTIVTTTIYEPTVAMKAFADMDGWSLIIVGDKKTPDKVYKKFEKRRKNVRFISHDEQSSKYPDLSELIGWNCIQRRNIGFIEAYLEGADVVATVDDDNIPYDCWGKDILLGERAGRCYTPAGNCFDPLYATNHPELWHRGFPLQFLSEREYFHETEETFDFSVQADFWDGDPDVDAICRMQFAPECSFDNSCFPFTSSCFSPFNSQNTFLRRDVLKDYFVFPHVGRMDDIWASYYVEALGHKVVYNKATVYQDRNEQDLTKNMTDEFIGYEKNEMLLDRLSVNTDNIKEFLPQRTWDAFMAYRDCFD